jgi:hypothetical protein
MKFARKNIVTSFCDGNSLLFHCFVNGYLVVGIHLIGRGREREKVQRKRDDYEISKKVATEKKNEQK